MDASKRFSYANSPATPLLPPELPLALLIVPPAAALLLERGFLGMSRAQKLGTLVSTRKSGRINIVARCEGRRAIIEVSDSGPRPGATNHRGNETSMQDLAQRLRLAFGEEGLFTLESPAQGGCCARLTIPLATNERF